MRLEIKFDQEVAQDVIGGSVSIVNAHCFILGKQMNGTIKLSVEMTLNKRMGYFARKKINIYEEIRDMALSKEVPNRFEFNLHEIELLTKKQLPDSYSGFGVTIQYFVTVNCYLCRVKEEIMVKARAPIECKPSELYINKNDINDFDGLLCISDVDFVPEVHAICKVNSSDVKITEGVKGDIKVDQCNMNIQSISVGLVQGEKLNIKGVNRDLQIVQETIEIATGHCVNRTISFFFFPEYSGVSRDYECEEAKLSFSLRVKILFSNQFYCIKYLPIHFSW